MEDELLALQGIAQGIPGLDKPRQLVVHARFEATVGLAPGAFSGFLHPNDNWPVTNSSHHLSPDLKNKDIPIG